MITVASETHWRSFGHRSSTLFCDDSWRQLKAPALARRIADENLVRENESFEYQVVVPPQKHPPYKKAIVMLHGLNERRWDRYLPWATALVQRLHRPVILFPIAFHMQRAPDAWSDPHAMYGVSLLRRRQNVAASSFANAALSTRLQSHPERFYWSGARTIADLSHLAGAIASDPLLLPESSLDLFGYSVGAFLSLVLLSSATSGPWTKARLFSFCGGCTLSDCNPVSKEILDEAGSAALRECFDHGLDRTLASNLVLATSFSQDAVGQAFHALLHPGRLADLRASLLAPLSNRIAAVALCQDRVMPAAAIERTLHAARARFDTIEPEFPCGHTQPFGTRLESQESTRAFNSVFDRAARWLD